MLSVSGLHSRYGRIEVLHGIDLEITSGEVIALIGANGAGKTTLLHCLSGVQPITAGTIFFRGEEIGKVPAHKRLRRGLALSPEGRQIFTNLTVEENLLTGSYTRGDGRAAVVEDLEKVYHYFPRLKERRGAQSGYTSGGEQQMTALGRALMARPSVILLDEPSMGLAPQLVEEIFEIVARLNTEEGVTFLLAEQNTNVALRFAKYGYILETGRVVMDGEAAMLSENEDVKEFYLGVSGEHRKSFRDVKHYRRRKRWLA